MTLASRVSRAAAPQRFNARAVSVFGVLTLGLALQGLFGLLAFVVERQRREIGVRLSLGARARDVVRLVAGRGLRLALLGLVVGLPLGYVLARASSAVLFGVTPADPATYALAGGALPPRRPPPACCRRARPRGSIPRPSSGSREPPTRGEHARLPPPGRRLRGPAPAAVARLHAGGGADAGARHRRDERHLQHRERGAAAAAAVPQPDRLVAVAQLWKGSPTVSSPQNFLDVEAQATSFERLAAIDRGRHAHGRRQRGAPRGRRGERRFFDVLRARPLLGRGFVAGENEPGRTKVVVLGHRLWLDRFGGDPGIVGGTIQIDREPRTVVGIAPPGFSHPEGAEIWTPMTYDERFRTNSRGAWYLTVIGRLAPGASVEQAREEVKTIAARLEQQYKDANEGVGGTADPAPRGAGGRHAPGAAGAAGRGGAGAAGGVRQRGEPAARAHHEPRERARAARGARRGARPHRPPAVHRERAAGDRGRRRRRAAGGHAGRRAARAPARGRAAPRRGERRPRRARLRRGAVAADERRVRRAARDPDEPQGDLPSRCAREAAGS